MITWVASGEKSQQRTAQEWVRVDWHTEESTSQSCRGKRRLQLKHYCSWLTASNNLVSYLLPTSDDKCCPLMLHKSNTLVEPLWPQRGCVEQEGEKRTQLTKLEYRGISSRTFTISCWGVSTGYGKSFIFPSSIWWLLYNHTESGLFPSKKLFLMTVVYIKQVPKQDHHANTFKLHICCKCCKMQLISCLGSWALPMLHCNAIGTKLKWLRKEPLRLFDRLTN